MPQTADQIVVEVTAVTGPYNQAMIQVANITINNMKKAEDAAEQGSGKIGKALETISGRVPDLIRNLADGQNALHLFLQEGAQILPIFGPWGVVLGGAVGAIDAIAASMGAYETAADRAKAAQDEFNAAIEATRGSFSEQEQDAIDASRALSLVERGLLGIARTKVEEAVKAQAATFKDVQAGAIEAGLAIANTIRAQQQELGLATDETRQKVLDLATELQNPNLSSRQYDAIVTALRELGPAAEQTGISTEKAVTAASNAGDAAAKLEANNKALGLTLERINELNTTGARLLRSLGFSASEAANGMESLTGAVHAFISESLRSVRAGELAKGEVERRVEQMEAEAAATLKGADAKKAYDNQQRITTAQQSAFNDELEKSGNVLKALALSERARIATQRQIEGEATIETQRSVPTRAKRSVPTEAKRSVGTRNETSENDPIADLQRQAGLNQRLIAVYQLGADAQARARAEVDALNAARQRGLELGTAEHAQYVQRYEDEAARKRQTDQRLADYAKADQLVEAAMTSQEKYENTKAEYERLRREGALTDAEYTRVLEKLNLENQGYVEGIQAIGQALQNGIQGATSFSDALTKVGIALAQMLLQAALFGNGPLGKAFGSLTKLGGGLLGVGMGDAGTVFGETVTNALTGTGGLYAKGGNPPVGIPSVVGEAGPELFVPRVPGTIIPTQMSQRLLSGRDTGAGQPITFNISMAGANGDRTIAEIAATAVKKGLASVPEINRQHRIRFA
ncbi:hypothetical protein ACFW16_09525 [Inquilinus sp. NPDC058860]|uniref:hypothetical protein n=1 Tax=Inquilinus sp. NPDC058860 TaxID=3346652 RepID=UPI003685014F